MKKSSLAFAGFFAAALFFSLHITAQQAWVKPQDFYTTDAAGNRTGLKFPALPYAYNALQPAIDSLTVSIHYDKHHRGYFTKTVAAVKENSLEGKPLEEIFASVSKYPEALRNNAGGFYNHVIYWENLGPANSSKPSPDLIQAIEKRFGSFDKFREQFSNAAKGKFGSGWAWLIVDSNKELQITTTSNQDNPLMDIAGVKGTPVLGIDVWEHAYYLKYQNKRADYVDAFWSIVNWDEVSRRYLAVFAK